MGTQRHRAGSIGTRVVTALAVSAVMGGFGGAAAAQDASPFTDPVTITFPNFQAIEEPYATWWNEFLQAYGEAYPNVNVEASSVANSGEAMTQAITQFAAGNPPHIIQQATGNFYQLADAGYLAPLDELLATTNVPTNWGPLQDQFRWDGQTYGVMTLSSALTLFYNKDLLAAAGVDVPTTAEELLAAAAAIHDPGNGIYGFAGTTTGTDSTIQNEVGAFVYGMGGGWFKDCQPNFTDPLVQQAVEAYAATLAFSAQGNAQSQRNTLFEAGLAGFEIDKASYIARLDPEQFGAAPLPFDRVAGNPNVFLAYPASLTGAEKWAAENFIRLAVSPEWQKRYAELIGAPAPDSAATAELAKTDPQMQLFADQMQRVVNILPAGCPDVLVQYPQIQRAIYDAMIQIVSTGAPVDATLQQLQDTVVGLLQ